MPDLRIIIKPSKHELLLPVEDKFFFDILNRIKKIKPSNKISEIAIPEIGYCGMILTFENSISVYVNNELIILKDENITEVYRDKNKRINNLLLKKALKKYKKELIYFFEVKKIKEKKQKKNNSGKTYLY